MNTFFDFGIQKCIFTSANFRKAADDNKRPNDVTKSPPTS